ncbi:MAG TPA: sensor histidine kinase [Aggregatilineaceae bacterium]|nr:sensor histidine kinase [Aggregatilineaceae bacterium]
MRAIEPGLFSVFRLFTGLRLFFSVIFTVARLAAPDSSLRLAELLDPLILMVLLLVPLVRSRHEWIILPLALIYAGVGPFWVLWETLDVVGTRQLPAESFLALQIWGSMIVLLLPAVLIGWQYRFWHVLVFSTGITVLNVVVIHQTDYAGEFESPLVTGSIAARMITFIVVGWLVARLMTAQRKQRDDLKLANTQLAHHAATLEQLAVTRERNRLARELHDTLAHTLSALAVQLEAVDALWKVKPEQAQVRLQRSIETTRSGLTETRRVLQNLRATPLEDLGLGLALKQLAESTAARSGVTLDLHIDKWLGGLSPDVEQCVYRIAQEALANVVNHANAAHLTVQLIRQSPYLTLTISDDGLGFAPEQLSAARFGIQGMRERADMIGGRLNVESQPGQGTIVVLAVEVGE